MMNPSLMQAVAAQHGVDLRHAAARHQIRRLAAAGRRLSRHGQVQVSLATTVPADLTRLAETREEQDLCLTARC
jgi:hypothetical protein